MESTLSVAWQELQSRVGSFLGWGRGAVYGDSAWTSQQQFELDGIVGSGLRRFYYPEPLQGESNSYDWSFLKPVATLNLASGAVLVPLPDDFGGFEGQITLASVSTQVSWPIDLVGIGRIYAQYAQYPTTTGRPLMACEEPLKGTTGTQGQRFQLRLWPTADQSYSLQFQYYILPDYLTGAFPYAYGGSAHAETILESCLAVAEKRLDDAATVHSQEFVTRLAASVSIDRKNKPQLLGYNGDRSDGRSWTRQDQHYLSLVKVYGVQH